MADLIGQPVYKDRVRQLEGTDPAVPATWNPQLQDLINNDAANKQALDAHEAALNPHTQYALATTLADHQAATPMDHPQGSVTDGHIGNRTPDQTLVPPANAAGTLTQLTSWVANRIRAITGATNWWDAPVKTLAALWALFDAAAGHKHDGTAGNGPKIAASVVTVTPAGNVSATTVQAAIQELDSEKLDSNGKAADSAKLNGYVQNAAAVAGTIPVRDAGGKVPGSITGDADTVDGKHAADFLGRWPGVNALLGMKQNVTTGGTWGHPELYCIDGNGVAYWVASGTLYRGNADGSVTTLAAVTSVGGKLGGMVYVNGYIYIGDYYGSNPWYFRVHTYGVSGNTWSVAATLSLGNASDHPGNASWDGNDTIYFIRTGGWTAVEKFTISTNALTEYGAGIITSNNASQSAAVLYNQSSPGLAWVINTDGALWSVNTVGNSATKILTSFALFGWVTGTSTTVNSAIWLDAGIALISANNVLQLADFTVPTARVISAIITSFAPIAKDLNGVYGSDAGVILMQV